MDIIPYYRGSSGLNIIDDPTRLSLNLDTGVTQMSEARNVILDRTGRVKLRFGYKKILSGSFHSLFSDGYSCYVGRTTDLLQVSPNLTLHGIRSSMAGLPITYSKAGKSIVYCNGGEKGIIKDSISTAWVKGLYGGPPTTKVFSEVPFADHLAFHAGQTFIAVGPVLYWSEPHRPDMFDFVRNMHQFVSDITMITPVQDGLYISDSSMTYFLRRQGNVFKQELVCPFPALKNTVATDTIEALEVGLQVPGLCKIWVSTKGVILGLPTGQVINLNGDYISYTGLTGISGGIYGDFYIHILDSKIYALNYRTRSTTEFTNFTFNSLVNFNGYTLATSDTGLYSIDYAYVDDDGEAIQSSGKFKTWDLGVHNTKRIRYAYLGLDISNNFIFTAQTDNDQEVLYTVVPKKQGQQGLRITLENIKQGRYWTFGFRNTGGGNFALDAIDILPIVRNAAI